MLYEDIPFPKFNSLKYICKSGRVRGYIILFVHGKIVMFGPKKTVCVCVFLYSLCIYSLLPLYVKDYAFWSTFCLTADTVPDYIYLYFSKKATKKKKCMEKKIFYSIDHWRNNLTTLVPYV